MTVCWITPLLGTAAAGLASDAGDVAVVDVRDLVDKAGNRADYVGEKIARGCQYLREGRRTVVTCDYGISRSNAVAAGILAKFERIPLEAAVRRVLTATGEGEIKLEPLMAVRDALGGGAAGNTEHTQKSILVTGGSGFVGTAVRRELANEIMVTAPARRDLDLEAGSTELDLLVAEHAADAIVHLANPRVYTSNIALGRTLTMLRNVIEVCTTRDVPLFFLSSWEIYSGYSGARLADESLAPYPRGPYGETKYLCEALIEHERRSLGLRCAILRSGPVYGAGSDKPKFIYNFIDKAFRGETILTHKYLNGDPALDLMHVDDIARAIACCVRLGFEGTLNLGTGIATSTFAIAAMLKQILGSASSIEQIAIEADTACIAMNASRAQAVLGWRPVIGLRKGLERLVSSYRGNGARK